MRSGVFEKVWVGSTTKDECTERLVGVRLGVVVG